MFRDEGGLKNRVKKKKETEGGEYNGWIKAGRSEENARSLYTEFLKGSH